MSNVTYSSHPSQPTTPVSQAEGESITKADVRKVLSAYAERDLQKVRWSSVIAGLFLAVGTQIMLALMGNAVGLAAANVRAPNPLSGIAVSAGLFSVMTVLASLLVGGFAASKLSGTIRRGDGMLAGVLTWSTMMVLSFFMVLHSLGASSGPVAQNAWFTFGGALLSLATAVLGGALGSVRGSKDLERAKEQR